MVCATYYALVQRPVFMRYNARNAAAPLKRRDYAEARREGLRTDFIAAAYLTAFPLLTLWLHTHAPFFNLQTVIAVVEGVVALIMALSSIADTALYRFWQFKLDSSMLVYLRSPREALASVSAGYIIGVFALIIFVWTCLFAMLMAMAYGLEVIKTPGAEGWWHLWAALTFILAAGGIFAAIRGIAHRPNTPCMVYYSTDMFLNHAALNPLYSFIYSLSLGDKYKGQFRYIKDDEACDDERRALIPTGGKPQTELFKTKRPNILLIIWESLCARYIAPLGGLPDVTPRFNELTREGVLFSRVAAGGTRTDVGLVCILSGYPGQPNTTVIKNTPKLPHLPALPRRLRDEGYETSLLHGGNLNYMHMVDYYMVTGHTDIVGLADLPEDAPKGPWGVHDNYTFDLLYDHIADMTARGRKWYTTHLTLSSHEPFRVPYRRLENDLHNSFAFTDDTFGRFIDRLKASPAWDDTLVIVLGDHGQNNTDVPLPHHLTPHIPILMIGGAIKEPRVIDTLMSQSDLAATILGQMGMSHDEFVFSRDVLADTYTEPFSMHCFNNGFVVTDERGHTTFDNVSTRATDGADERREHIGRIILQSLYTNLSRL